MTNNIVNSYIDTSISLSILFILRNIYLCHKEDEIYDFISYIFKMKYLLKIQLINKLKYLEKNILFNLNNKYDFLRGDENNV